MENNPRWRNSDSWVELMEDYDPGSSIKDHLLTANMKLTMMSMYLAHFMPEFSCSSLFDILLFAVSLGCQLQFVEVLIAGRFRYIV